MPNTYRAPGLAIQLSENASNAPTKIQLIRTGSFHHPTYGKFDVTRDHLASFKKNFDAKVRGVDLALDYGHNSGGEAAGWFKNLILSDDGTQLWAETDWTPEGANAVQSKRYRYVSADFNFDYTDNETLAKHGPTLLGAGLTNRPVVKNQAPVVELSEGKGEEMSNPAPAAAKDPKDEKIAQLEAEIEALKAQLGAAPDAAKQLSEVNVQLSEAKTKIQTLETERANAEKKARFDKQLSEGKVCEAQRVHFMSGDMDKFVEAAQNVKLAETGTATNNSTGGETGDGTKPAADEVYELAEKAFADKKAPSFQKAVTLVLSENPKLAERFNKSL